LERSKCQVRFLILGLSWLCSLAFLVFFLGGGESKLLLEITE